MAGKFNAIASRRAPIEARVMGKAPKGEGVAGGDRIPERPIGYRAGFHIQAGRYLGRATKLIDEGSRLHDARHKSLCVILSNSQNVEEEHHQMSAKIIIMSNVKAGRSLSEAAQDTHAIGRRLQAARLAAGLRQRDIAALAGVGQSSAANWETGTRRPKVSEAARLIPVLQITLDWLYLGDDRGLRWDTREKIQKFLADLPEFSDASALRSAS
jgi:transcriptional regulator with XRE-family HTH domain